MCGMMQIIDFDVKEIVENMIYNFKDDTVF